MTLRPSFVARLIRWIAVGSLAFAAPVVAASTRVHVVGRGETLIQIAGKYEVTVQELARANRLRDVDLVRRGQKLVIPLRATGFIEHRVRKGESLAAIAKRYRVNVADIRAHNALPDPNHIVPGQVVLIPAPWKSDPAPPAATPPAPAPAAPTALPSTVQAAIDDARVQRGRWEHIVIHHSGTREGSGKGMDRYHREERHMENGLAYHFVIGNGHGMRDGEIYVGARWREQLDGGHLAIPELNANSLGICLVGDFQKSRPSARQLQSLEALVRELQQRCGIALGGVTSHRMIHPRHTQCPGRYFPMSAFLARLKLPAQAVARSPAGPLPSSCSTSACPTAAASTSAASCAPPAACR